MKGFKHEPTLHGWDDEKVYFIDEAGEEWCVSDDPDLLARLVKTCKNYFAKANPKTRKNQKRAQ